MSIRNTMYLTICTMILVPFLLFGLLVSHIYNGSLRTSIEDSLQSVANAQTMEMTSFSEQQMHELALLGDTEVFHAALRGELDQSTIDFLSNMLFSRVGQTDYLYTSALLDCNYRVVACSEATYELQADAARMEALVEKMGENSFYISNVSDSEVAGEVRKAVIAISKIEDQGETLGYMIAEISLDFYRMIRKQTRLWEESTFYLLDGNGQIISAGTVDDDRYSFITTKEERGNYHEKYDNIDFEQNPRGSFSYEIGGQTYITYYSDVAYTDWQIQLTVNMSDYLAQDTVHTVQIVFLILLAVVAAVWIGFFTSRRIVQPISRISDTLNEIERRQDYSLRVKTERADELGRLSEEINQLLAFTEAENRDKEKKELLLKEKAERDALTQVMNKEMVERYLQKALARCREKKEQLAVLFIDIDDFKAFNTRYGHSEGDRVLHYFAGLLERCTKETVGRLGGDEFLVIIENQETIGNLEEILMAAGGNIQNELQMQDGAILSVSCSIGAIRIDFSTEDTADITFRKVIDLADRLMYQVKNEGKRGYLIREYQSLTEQEWKEL